MDRSKKFDNEYTPTARLAGGPKLSEAQNATEESGRFSDGDRLAGRFHIERWIANGGMGEVYEARDLELDQQIAIKVIRPEIAFDLKAMERFRREIALARQVTHPNVCRIFDFFYHSSDASGPVETAASADDVAFLTMELLAGQTLSDYLAPKVPLATAEALPLVRQMVAALGAAHDAGVVHRDYKCSNVMIVEGAQEPRLVVTDFGLARSAVKGEPQADVTLAGEILGSPAYMAPEQVLEEEITPAVDIYALGVVLYRMVTGRLPYEAPTRFGLLAKRVKEEPEPPRQLVAGLDPRWSDAILKCLARKPEDRFASVRDLLDVLEPSEVMPAPVLGGVQKPRRLAVWSLLAVLGVAGIGTVALLSDLHLSSPGISAAEARSSVAVLGFHNLSERPDAEWLSTALAELLSTELASSEELRVVPGENVVQMKRDLDLPRVEDLALDSIQQIGRHLGSEHLVLGSFYAAGEAGGHRLRLDLGLQSTATGERIATLSETASESELLALVERIGEALRRELGSEIGAESPRITASMPTNPKAVRSYTEGLDALRAFDPLGARDRLLEAIAVEPEFPHAHAALAKTYADLGYDAESLEQIRLAFSYSREAPRQERMLIEGQYREQTGDWDGAVATYRSLFETFPDDLEYGLDLLRVQVQAGRPEEAEETLESLRRLPAPASGDPRIDKLEFELALHRAQYQRALDAAGEGAARSREIGAELLAARTRLDEGKALQRLGRFAESEEAAREAYMALLDLGDRAQAARALDIRANALFFLGELEASLATHDEALAIFRDLGTRSGVFSVISNKAITLLELGRFEATAALQREALEIARAVGKKDKLVTSLANLAVTLKTMGDSASALRLQEESLDIARQIGNPELVARRLYGIATLWTQKDLNTAHEKMQEVTKAFEEFGRPSLLAVALLGGAQIDMLQGRFESAAQKLDGSTEIHSQLEKPQNRFEVRYYRALLAQTQGQMDEAVDLGWELAEELKEQQLLYYEAEVRSVLALAYLARGELEAARIAFDRALEVVPAAVLDGLFVHHASLEGRLLAAEGKPEEALVLLEGELARMQELGRFDRQLETRFTLGELELAHGRKEVGLEKLELLATDAEAAGFYLMASRARQAVDAHADR